jgi:hypothetical protein
MAARKGAPKMNVALGRTHAPQPKAAPKGGGFPKSTTRKAVKKGTFFHGGKSANSSNSGGGGGTKRDRKGRFT